MPDLAQWQGTPPLVRVGAAGAPPFQSGVTNYPGGGASGEPFVPACFYKDGSGLIHIEATLLLPVNLAAGSGLFQLPAAFAPIAQRVFTVWDALGNVPARADLLGAQSGFPGTLVNNAAGAAGGSIYCVSLAYDPAI